LAPIEYISRGGGHQNKYHQGKYHSPIPNPLAGGKDGRAVGGRFSIFEKNPKKIHQSRSLNSGRAVVVLLVSSFTGGPQHKLVFNTLGGVGGAKVGFTL